MSIAENFPELTPEEISALMIVRASGPGGYAMHECPTQQGMASLLYHLRRRGLIEFKTAAVETPAGKAVRP